MGQPARRHSSSVLAPPCPTMMTGPGGEAAMTSFQARTARACASSALPAAVGQAGMGKQGAGRAVVLVVGADSRYCRG